MWQSPLLAAVVGREGCEERGGLAASPFGTTEAFGPVCFARALLSTIDEMGPDMLLTRWPDFRIALRLIRRVLEGRNHQGVDS